MISPSFSFSAAASFSCTRMSEPMGTVDVLVVFPQILELVWPHADRRKREAARCPVAQQVVSEGHGGCPGDAVADGGDFPRCGGLRRPGLEDIVDEQVGFDLVEDVAEAWAGHSECLAERENEVAREIFCGVAARRKKLREFAGGEMDFHSVDFVIVKGRRGFNGREEYRSGTKMDVEVAVVELIGQFQLSGEGGGKPEKGTVAEGKSTEGKGKRAAATVEETEMWCSHLFPGLLRHHALYRFGYIFSVKPAIIIPRHLRGDAQLHRHPGADKLLGVHRNGYYRNSKVDVVDVLPFNFPASVDQTEFGGHLQGPWDGDEGIRGCTSNGVEDGGDVPRCGGLRRPGLEGIIDEQVGFDLVEDVAEAWAGHSECLAEWENEVAREIFCGVTAWRKKLREISGGVQQSSDSSAAVLSIACFPFIFICAFTSLTLALISSPAFSATTLFTALPMSSAWSRPSSSLKTSVAMPSSTAILAVTNCSECMGMAINGIPKCMLSRKEFHPHCITNPPTLGWLRILI
nr:hypothetical protein CFOL_v3_12690 [Ipomoea batatas]